MNQSKPDYRVIHATDGLGGQHIYSTVPLPAWAAKAIREHPEHATVICDAVAVQSGLIQPPIPMRQRSWWEFWK